ncbi:MAG: nicotinate-nucleotide adenylyltransferase [Burkholderiales bacterium]|nr:nicotinate-nucleotide adenylyltransferase [Burkholderiales bacterium]
MSAPVGVLGGTFDPIHFAHLRLAHEAWERLGLDHVRLVPSATPPHRALPGVSAEHRLAMVQRAVADHPGLRADGRELDRTGPSYTIDTLEGLRAELPPATPLCLILGADAFLLLTTWKRWEALFDQAHLVVAHRPGHPPDRWTAGMEPALRRAFESRLTAGISDLHASASGRIYALGITQLDISSTAIRTAIAAGRSPRYLLPPNVIDYIGLQQLYKDPDAR